jgi:hypothetical protein
MFQASQAKAKEIQQPKIKPKETFSQSLMNYEIIRDKVQTQFVPKSTPNKSNPSKKKLINF